MSFTTIIRRRARATAAMPRPLLAAASPTATARPILHLKAANAG